MLIFVPTLSPCSHEEKNEDILSINLPALFSLPEFTTYTEKRMAPKSSKPSIVWQVYVHKLRAWAPPISVKLEDLENSEEGASFIPARPHLILVVDTSTGKFLTSKEDENGKGEDVNIVRGPEPPSNEYIVEYIEKILKNPKVLNEKDGEEEKEKESKTKKIEKPTKIVFACTKTATNTDTSDEESCSYVKGTRNLLKKLDIQTGFASVPREIIENIIREQIEPNMNPPAEEWSTEHLPGLMESVDGFTPKFGLSLFAAAIQYLSAVTQHGEKLEKIKFFNIEYGLRLDENNKATLSCCVTIDHSNCTLTVYKNEAEAKKIIEELEKEEGEEVDMTKKSLQNCLFLGEELSPFEDIDAKEKYDWPCAASAGEDTSGEEVKERDMYPVFTKMDFEEDGTLTIRRPQLVELQMFEVALNAISASLLNPDQNKIGIQMTSYAMKGEPKEVKAFIEARDGTDSGGVTAAENISEKVGKLDIA